MARRILVIALLLLSLAAVAGAGLAAWERARVGPIYALAQVQAGLYRNPGAWVGRTVRVRAEIYMTEDYGTTPAASGRGPGYPNLLDPPPGSNMAITLGPVASPRAAPGDAYPAVELVVGARPPDPLLSSLRRLPAIREIAPAPDFAATPQNMWSPHVFVLRLLPRGQLVDAVLLDAR